MENVSYCPKDLLPHAPPMVLLDEILEWGQGKAVAALTIHISSRFCVENKGVPTYVGLEYMAQTCGIYAGIESLGHGQQIRLGFLLGTRNFHASRDWFRLGDRLTIMVKEMFRQEGMGVFDCRITNDGEEIASAQLSLYRPEDNSSDNIGQLAKG